MNLLTSYYYIKPLLPRRIQISTRRAIARYKRKAVTKIWPIHPGAARTPEGWPGWPENKRFALILSHDVDTARGRDRAIPLMEMERSLGFKSAFNFVAGDYQVPSVLLQELRTAGFEIGLHGLRHNGKLFSARKIFDDSIPIINHYLKNWGAVGFHSPSTHRNLDWIADLDIQYDSSTFDTDPFEPQPDGIKTIFPLWIMNKSKTRGYVEFPYTLPQDHGLFIILQEKDTRIWKEKLAWVVKHSGMVFLNTHPDYMRFDRGRLSLEEYPASFYKEFLEYIQDNYAGQYWNALPRDAANLWKSTMVDGLKASREHLPANHAPNRSPTEIKIWIDLDNTPHVPFFIPIIDELERRGHQIILTARDAFQVCELADEKGLPYIKIGRHYGKNPILKISGLIWRSFQLAQFFLQHRPDVALSHGSRSQVFYCNLMKIPSILIADYEHAQTIPFAHPRWSIVPDVLPTVGLSSAEDRIRHYRGIKEDVYVPGFIPDPTLPGALGLRPEEMLITVRPPADEAHYSNPESDRLLLELMKRIVQEQKARVVLLPRNLHQEQLLRAAHPEWFLDSRTIIPTKAVDGLNLLWFSDLVVSGGGTMNREAAALGVPVYSIFRGKTGKVDRMLARDGRLILIQTTEEVWTKIQIVPREKLSWSDNKLRPALFDIVNHIEDIITFEMEKRIKGRPLK